MVAWTNRAVYQLARNGTTSHTVDPTSSTGLVSGATFTPTTGSRLVVVLEGAVTSTTPSGWTLPSGGSAINETGMYVWHRVAAAGSNSFTTTHNGSNYTVAVTIYEFPSGSTFVGSASGINVTMGAANPNLTGLPGTSVLVMAAKAKGVAGADGYNATTWTGTGSPTKDVDLFAAFSSTDGYAFSLAYVEGYTGTSWQPTGTMNGSGAAGEALTFAISVASGGTNYNATATATGVAAVGATAVVSRNPTAAVTGTGAVSATASVSANPTGAAVVTGVGAVSATAVVQENASAAITGVAAVAATAVVQENAAASITAVAGVSATAAVVSGSSSSVNVVGTGAVSATALVAGTAVSTVVGTVAVTAVAVVQARVGADVAATGAVSATALVTAAGSISAGVTGVGAVSATAAVGLSSSVSIGGTARVSAATDAAPVGDTGDMSNQDLERQYLLAISTDPGEDFDSTPDLRDVIYGDRQSSGVSSVGVSAADAEIASLRAASSNPNKDRMSLSDLRRERWGG